MAAKPKLFVSYCWSSPEHEAWVLDLGTSLCNSGIEVILDKWDLKEGHDAHKFMEQMVSDPEIKKVVIVCDRKYAEKADGRSGGVGIETQIISPEIYAKSAQRKFVVVVAERAEDGTPYLPAYYRSRIYIDLSDDSSYARNYEQLVRWVHDKPLHVKPPIGPLPTFSKGAALSTPSSAALRRALEAFRGAKESRSGALDEYLEQLAMQIEAFRIADDDTSGTSFDDRVIESIEQYTPLRNEAIELFQTLAQYDPSRATAKSLHRFFERLLPLLDRPAHITSWRDWDFDNFRFIAQELLLNCVGCLLRYERFSAVASLMETGFFADLPSEAHVGMVPYTAFWDSMRSLEYRNSRLRPGRLSLRAELLESRSKTSGLSFEHLMQADFVLYLRSALDLVRTDAWHPWWPDTLVYSHRKRTPFEVFARSQSRTYFDEVRHMFAVERKEDFLPLFEAQKSGQLNVPTWQFHRVDVGRLMGYTALATRP